MKPRVLITGITGFTGKYLAARLDAAGYEVFGNSLYHTAGKNIFQADLNDLDSMRHLVALAKPDMVAHLGGVSFVAHENPGNMYYTNIGGARNLLQALSELQTPPKTIMLASSAQVYGNSNNNPITEQSDLMPHNDYAVSKVAMEQMARLWQTKLPIFIVRPFNYTGVGQADNFLIPKIVTHFVQKAPEIELGNLDVYREFNDVRLVADIYQRLLEAAPVGKTINICTGELYSLQELLDIMNQIAGYKIRAKINPDYVRENEIKKLCGSNALLQSLIDPVEPIALYDTLTWMFTHKKNRHENKV